MILSAEKQKLFLCYPSLETLFRNSARFNTGIEETNGFVGATMTQKQ